MTSEELKTTIINNLRLSTYPKVVNFANGVGNKCWADLAYEFYNTQNFTIDEKREILNILLGMNNELVNKILIIFVENEDEFVLNQLLVNADNKMKRFLARYSSSDNIRLTLLNQNPDKELLKEIIAGMRDKSKVEQYKNSSDIELKHAFYTRIDKSILVKRLWR